MATSSEIENRETQSHDRGPSSSTPREQTGCCGGEAPKGAEACCALDAELKSAGGSGCGCASNATAGAPEKKRCC